MSGQFSESVVKDPAEVESGVEDAALAWFGELGYEAEPKRWGR